jgi:hypothetical protein
MDTYCITAANHKNKSNHVASSFLVWLLDTEADVWRKQGPKSAKEVVALIEAGNKVLTGKENEKTISSGEPIEVELRIAKNKTNYDISNMPTF